MKKWLFTLVLSILIVSLLSTTTAQSPLGVDEKIDQFEETRKQIESSPSEYLKQKWSNIFENTFFGKAMKSTEQILTPFNPIFKTILGLEFAWSWLFILNLILWVFLIILIYRIFSIFVLFSNWLRYLISILAIVLISAIGITTALSNLIIDLISKADSIISQTIIAIAIIIILVALSVYSKYLEHVFSKTKEQQEKRKTKRTARQAKEIAKQTRQELESTREQRKERTMREEIKKQAESEVKGMSKK